MSITVILLVCILRRLSRQADAGGGAHRGCEGECGQVAEHNGRYDADDAENDRRAAQLHCHRLLFLPEQQQSGDSGGDGKNMPRIGQNIGDEAPHIFAVQLIFMRSGGAEQLRGVILRRAVALVDEHVPCAADLFLNVLVYGKLLGLGIKRGFFSLKGRSGLADGLTVRVEPLRPSRDAAAYGFKLRFRGSYLRLGGLESGLALHELVICRVKPRLALGKLCFRLGDKRLSRVKPRLHLCDVFVAQLHARLCAHGLKRLLMAHAAGLETLDRAEHILIHADAFFVFLLLLLKFGGSRVVGRLTLVVGRPSGLEPASALAQGVCAAQGVFAHAVRYELAVIFQNVLVVFAVGGLIFAVLGLVCRVFRVVSCFGAFISGLALGKLQVVFSQALQLVMKIRV